MRRKTWLAVLAALGLVVFGVGAWLLLRPTDPDWVAADEFVLYSVDGRDVFQKERKPPPPGTGETLHNYAVLGKVAVDDPAVRRKLEATFRKATVNLGMQAKCFWPRHVVRLRHGDIQTDYIICFECSQYERRVNGVKSHGAPYIDSQARPAFDAPLTAAGVPFAPDL